MNHGILQQSLILTSRCSRRLYHSSGSSPKSVARLLESASQENVTIHGYIRSIRNQKARSFAVIGDGTSLDAVQALLTPAQAQSLSTGAAVSLSGRWTESPRGTTQSHELHVQHVNVLGTADPAVCNRMGTHITDVDANLQCCQTYPLQKKYQTAEYLRSMPHMRMRTPFNSLLLRFRSHSIAQLTQFFLKKDFVQTHPPIITSSDCEGAGEVFNVTTRDAKGSLIYRTSDHGTESDDGSFFRSPKYLTVSSQLHLEAMAQSVGNVWTLSPTFRAEKSDTSRHLSEFYMLEAEASFVDDLDAIMALLEEMLQDLTTTLHDSRVGQEIIHGKRTGEIGVETQPVSRSEELEQRWSGMMKGSWPRVTYTDAIDLLRESGQNFQHLPSWGAGLQAEHERFIAETVGKGQPVFVTRFPRTIKPFYMLRSSGASSSGPTVDCFDLLVPEACEISGGSMREHRLPHLLDSMQLHGLVTGPGSGASGDAVHDESGGTLKWYTDLRRWGSVPHGGFGLGFDRLLGYLAGVQNIREVVSFPRWVGRCDC